MISTYLGTIVKLDKINTLLIGESDINKNTYFIFQKEFMLLWKNKFLEGNYTILNKLREFLSSIAEQLFLRLSFSMICT